MTVPDAIVMTTLMALSELSKNTFGQICKVLNSFDRQANLYELVGATGQMSSFVLTRRRNGTDKQMHVDGPGLMGRTRRSVLTG